MQKITLFILGAFISFGVLAQRPEVVIMKASVDPVIDGVVDDVWAEAGDEYYIEGYGADADPPTLGDPGETTWQGLWTDDGIYVLLRVADDDFYPHYLVADSYSWEYDKPELYFDVNWTLEDGLGPQAGVTSGHYQVAPPFVDGSIDGTLLTCGFNGTEGTIIQYAALVDDPTYISEYFVPWEDLVDDQGIGVDITGQIGFDVTIIDRDEGDEANRSAVWSNAGDVASSWNNMDDCGIITLDGAEPPTLTESIELTGGTIEENNGMLQIGVVITPEEASDKLLWSVDSEVGGAQPLKISPDGMVTAVMEGTWTVTAMATDQSYEEASCEVIVKEQIVTRSEINLMRNGYFDEVNPDQTPAEWTNNGKSLVSEGVCVVDPDEGPNLWDFRLQQQGGWGLNNSDYYAFSFVLWSDESDTMNLDFEDAREATSYLRYGVSGHELSNGRSDWTFQSPTERTRYVFDVQFVDLLDESNEQFQFMLGHHDPVVYIDSVELINLKDLEKLTADYVAVETIAVSAEGDATKVTVGETLQLSAEVLPAEATLTGVRWMLDTTYSGQATISEDGLLEGVAFGPVMVKAMAKDDSKVYGELAITVTGPAGIGEKSVTTLKIYPNPASDHIRVDLPVECDYARIFSSSGTLMKEVRVSGQNLHLDISSYAPGVYYIRAGDALGKFVK